MRAPDWSAYDRYITTIEHARTELDAVLAEYVFGIADYAEIDRLARVLSERSNAATIEIHNITTALAAEFGQ